MFCSWCMFLCLMIRNCAKLQTVHQTSALWPQLPRENSCLWPPRTDTEVSFTHVLRKKKKRRKNWTIQLKGFLKLATRIFWERLHFINDCPKKPPQTSCSLLSKVPSCYNTAFSLLKSMFLLVGFWIWATSSWFHSTPLDSMFQNTLSACSSSRGIKSISH